MHARRTHLLVAVVACRSRSGPTARPCRKGPRWGRKRAVDWVEWMAARRAARRAGWRGAAGVAGTGRMRAAVMAARWGRSWVGVRAAMRGCWRADWWGHCWAVRWGWRTAERTDLMKAASWVSRTVGRWVLMTITAMKVVSCFFNSQHTSKPQKRRSSNTNDKTCDCKSGNHALLSCYQHT